MVSLQLGCCKVSHRLATPVSVISLPSRFSVVSLQLWCCKASHRLATPVSLISLTPRFSVVNLQLWCCKASDSIATLVAVISLPPRFRVVSLQLGCCKASPRLATPVSLILLASRVSVASLQLGCCKASDNIATLVSVNSIPSRFSVVSLQLGCCKASHKLATPVLVISICCRLSVINFLTTNRLITSTHSSVKSLDNKFSSDTRQCPLFSELQSRCNPYSVSCERLSSNFLTVTNLSAHLCCASLASSLFSSVTVSNTNDASMQFTSDKFSNAMTPSEIQNAWGLFLMNFLANSLLWYSFRHVILRADSMKGDSNNFTISSTFPSVCIKPAMNWKTISEHFSCGTRFSFTNQRAAKNSWKVWWKKLKCLAVVIDAVLKDWPQ